MGIMPSRPGSPDGIRAWYGIHKCGLRRVEMRIAFTSLMVVAIAAFVLSVSPRSVAQQGGAQGAPAAGGGQARPSPTANLPFDPKDFSGVWGGQTMSGPNRQFTREEPPMTPAGLAFYK